MANLIGQTLGPYQLEALIGTGGMGDVYRDLHLHLKRADAVKVLHPHVAANPNLQARFQQEAAAAANLRHPNIIEVYDFREQQGRYYLAMELAAGGSVRGLAQRYTVQGQVMPLTLALDLVCQAAEGLAFAHLCLLRRVLSCRM